MQKVLEVTSLLKRFGSFTAVDDISFSVAQGEIVGLLGPNGAGKTTTIQMLLGLTTSTSGTISYFGKEFTRHREEILSKINFASTYSHIQSRMTVRQSFRIYAGLYGMDASDRRMSELLHLLEVEDVADKLFWHLSSGQQTRVILAKALLNKPRLILMDEPTASLDPDIASKVRDLILTLQKKERVTLLITSHDMSEVEQLCDRVIFLQHGKIVAEDTPLGLTKRIGESKVTVTFDGSADPVSAYLERKAYKHHFPRIHVVVVEVAETDVPKVLFGLSNEGIWLTNIEIQKPNLEDVFLSVVAGNYENLSH
ncbi:MAG: ABC-type transport system, ATP-binding component [Candidatus Nomurabacteria bacterium GW2011_GWB1_37_5]|uniref:ABC-type transport system, ATP-binding component n=1 Tax=Candidatus Nomurabacteria bacterium GW2011_GWB1_37_5 TaxID=1618742 RepID=A0A0G0JB47_9BACT|nr:MAG: ABC-type transport system, ATP-binding component [Candidatus Nomurabacteria bacterium GW2011_GWB1_37_5]